MGRPMFRCELAQKLHQHWGDESSKTHTSLEAPAMPAREEDVENPSNPGMRSSDNLNKWNF